MLKTKCCRELVLELLRLDPEGGAISQTTHSIAVANLNSRLRGQGLSSWEILNQRDQFTGEQIPISDDNFANY